MKTIVIIWTERLNEQRGGIHRIILLLLKHLPNKGFKTHYLYTLDDYKTFQTFNKDKSQEETLDVKELRNYLIYHECNIIIGQDAIYSSKLTSLIKKLSLPNLKLINEYHSSFYLIPKKLNRNYLKFEFKQNKSFFYRFSIIVKYIFYPIWKRSVWNRVTKSSQYNLKYSDIVLLLSKKEEAIVKQITKGNFTPNCKVIPNPLSWENIEDINILKKKKNEILVVSRIYNPEKRIDLVLKIWKVLQDKGATRNWTLRIIGDGMHKKLLMKMAIDMKLQHVVWEGWRDPLPFYKTASIFMMTSACEGWGLTLTESMQTGTVPIAMDTYPALHDIITDGYDGYIIKPNDLVSYAGRIQTLIQNHKHREQMAINALQSCRRFATNTIMDKWADMLNSL